MGARQIKNRVVLLSHASDFIEIANCQRGIVFAGGGKAIMKGARAC